MPSPSLCLPAKQLDNNSQHFCASEHSSIGTACMAEGMISARTSLLQDPQRYRRGA